MLMFPGMSCFHLMTLRVVALFIHYVYSIKCFSVSDPCPDELVGYVRHRDSREEDRFPNYLVAHIVDFQFHNRRFPGVVLFVSPFLCF